LDRYESTLTRKEDHAMREKSRPVPSATRKVNAKEPKQDSLVGFIELHPDMAIAGGVVLAVVVVAWAVSRSTRTSATANPTTPDFLQPFVPTQTSFSTKNIGVDLSNDPNLQTVTNVGNQTTTENVDIQPPPVRHGGIYVVRTHDSLSSIAHKLQVSPDHLWQSNRYTISQAMWDHGIRPRVSFDRGPMPSGLRVYPGEKLAY
jgi:hypothetical protein